MDEIDVKILKLLQSNARLTYKEIAEAINLTPTPVFDRIKKLEKKGIIEKYVTIVSPDSVGQKLTVYCQLTLIKQTKEFSEPFELAIDNLPEIVECHFVSGNFDYLLKIAVPNMAYFHEFHQTTLSGLPGVSTIHSFFIMSSIKNTTATPVYL